MSEERPKVSDHWMILRCGVQTWNRLRKESLGIRPKLRGANLKNANLGGANLGGANLKGADLKGADLKGADLGFAILRNADLAKADLKDADLGGAYLGNAYLRDANFTGAKLGRADLAGADLVRANLGGANLREICLRETILRRAYLVHADLRGADLRNADLRNADLKDASFGWAYLAGTNLEDADLKGADLKGADLKNANLRRADLTGANLVRADLAGADLGNASLEHGNFEGANLAGANLAGANLRGTNFTGAKLGGAYLARDLVRATLRSTLFHNVDLREVKGLKGANHSGPSAVSSQTLEMSRGQIPKGFLKGCGLKDWEILAAKLHDPNLRPDQVMDIGYEVLQIRATSPIVPLSVFISYSHANTSFVEKLEARFDKDGVRYWRDVHDLKAGPIEHQVDRAIGMQRATLLVLSEDSVESDWVEHEARKARQVEKARRKGGGGKYVLCPIALDESWKGCDWPEVLRDQIEKYTILDFSRWGSDEEFEKVYEKLKTGLGIYYADKGPGPQ